MEFIAIVLDVGSHMYDDIDNINSIIQGISSVKRFIKKKLFSESKDEIAVILCYSHETSNSLNNGDCANFKHINIIRNLAKVDWELIETLNENDRRFGSDKGDLVEAILVAADHLVCEIKFRHLKGSKKIVVISNLEGETDFSQLNSVLNGLAQEEIELNVISDRDFHNNKNTKDGHDDVDENNGPSTSNDNRTSRFNEKMSENRVKNEKGLSKMIAKLNGATYSFEDALLSLDFFETKSTEPRGWKANLEISDICQISVVGYSKVKAAHPQSLKLRYGGDPTAEVERRTTYHLSDEKNTPVSLEDTIKGFKYGNSLVPFTEEDISSMELSVVKGLKLIGFCEDENVSRDLYVGDSSLIFVADNPASEPVFTALVHAMYECNVVALVRRVYHRVSAPRLAVLSPVIKSDSLSLVYCELAFGEDIRTCVFPSLPSSVSSNTNKAHISSKSKTPVISEEQLQAVDKFIDHMMLVKKDKNDEINKETEIYKPSTTVSPSIQMFYHCASHKFLNPTVALPELNERVLSTLSPPKENLIGLDDLINNLKALFPLKNRENILKKKKPMTNDESKENGSAKRTKTAIMEPLPASSGDMIGTKIGEVGLASPVEDFNRLLEQDHVIGAFEDMEPVIWQLINNSYLDTLYPKAITCLRELRQRSIEYSRVDRDLISRFNEFLKNMKQSLLVSQSKTTFWNTLKEENINLIGESEAYSGCQDEERRCFFDTKEECELAPTLKEEDMDTLFDDM